MAEQSVNKSMYAAKSPEEELGETAMSDTSSTMSPEEEEEEEEGLDAFMSSMGGDPQSIKRKNSQEDNEVKKKPKPLNKKNPRKPKVYENKAVFVKNLPLDTDEDEIADCFKRAGIINEGADGKKRITMYTDDQGDFNGEALIVFFKKDSVPAAIKSFNDYWYRPEDFSHKIFVEEADFSYKRNTDGDQIKTSLSRKDKKALADVQAKLTRELTSWDSGDEEVKGSEVSTRNRWNKTVILKNMFILQERGDDNKFYSELKDDIREDAKEFGAVTNVTLYHEEEVGVLTVKFRDFEAADEYCADCHGRRFAGRTVEATLAEAMPRFKKINVETK